MKKHLSVIYGIVMAAFYIGAACFFADGNTLAGILGLIAGTCSLVAMILNRNASKTE